MEREGCFVQKVGSLGRWRPKTISEVLLRVKGFSGVSWRQEELAVGPRLEAALDRKSVV